jgi:hypothetical protein
MFGIISRQTLRRGEGGRERSGLQRAVHCAGRPAFRLHLGDFRNDIPKMVLPRLAHSSQDSAMAELGVMGKIAMASLKRKATEAAASLASTVMRFTSGTGFFLSDLPQRLGCSGYLHLRELLSSTQKNVQR